MLHPWHLTCLHPSWACFSSLPFRIFQYDWFPFLPVSGFWFAGACTLSRACSPWVMYSAPVKKGFCACVGVVQHGGVGMLEVAAQ